MSDIQFRFQGMKIWKRAVHLSQSLFDFLDTLEQKKLYRFSEQLRGATLSITNNIAEGSGSDSDAEFAHFLNIARRSLYEVANILMLLSKQGYIKGKDIETILQELEQQSKMLMAFRRSLKL